MEGQDILTGLAGVILSLALAYVPKLKDWYGCLSGDWKRVVMAGLLVLASVLVYVTTCTGWVTLPLVTNVGCDNSGIQRLIGMLIMALVANQGTYLLAVQDRQAEPDCQVG